MRIQTPRILLLIGVIVFPTFSDAAPPRGADETSTANNLLLTQDRQMDLWLDTAQKELDSGDFGAAAVLLQRILTAEDDSMVTGPETAMVTSRQRAIRLASRLPNETRARLDADLDRVARDVWVNTPQESLEAVSAFASHYRASVSGLDALKYLAGRHHDSGRHQQAAAAWQSIIRHPRATAAQQMSARVAHIESLLMGGQLAAAEAAFKEPVWNDFEGTIAIAGKKIVPRQWVAQRLEVVRQKKPTKAGLVEQGRPALQPVWSREVPLINNDLQKSVDQVRRYYREEGIVSSPVVRPVVIGNLVLMRTMQELMAFDALSGEPLWTIPNQDARRPAFLESTPYRINVATAWLRRVEADSAFGALSTDGKLAVIIQEPDRSNVEFSFSNAQVRGMVNQPAANTRWNRLCGYEVSNGQLRWQMGGAPTGPADVFGGMTFLGTPLFIDDVLFVIGRRDDDLWLLAMDRDTGHLRWDLKLGVLAPHLADAAFRRRIACPVTLVDGLLLCPTASGTLVAVNPTTRSMEWAVRYPMVQHDLPVRLANGVPTTPLPDAWWNEWREVACLIAGPAGATSKTVVFASPDCDQLLAINTSDGSSVWSAPRQGALHVEGTAADMVIVLEPMAVRAHDVQTGKLRWRTETGEISGRGTIVGNLLIQPKRTGGFAVVSLVDGTQLPSLSAADAVYGPLVKAEGGWITQIDQSLHRLPLLDLVSKKALSRWESDRNETAAIDLARLELQLGQPVSARQRMEGINSLEARSMRREVTMALLRTPTRPEDRKSLGRELLESCESNEERLVALRVLADAARAAGDLSNALNKYLDGMELAEEIGISSLDDWSVDSGSRRLVRADRVLLGGIDSIMRDVQGSSRQAEMEQILQDRLDKARSSTDLFAAGRLIDRLLPLEWARKALLKNSEAVLYARPLEKAEPLLLSLVGSANRETSAVALDQLARSQLQSGWRMDSEALQRRILFEHPGTPLSDGRSLAVTLASSAEQTDLRDRLLSPAPDRWPSVLPMEATEDTLTKRLDPAYVPVRVQAPHGSFFERLDLTVKRDGRSVRFTCEGFSGSWSRDLEGKNVLRQAFANQDNVEAFGVGRMLILRVGSEVFRILPFNERGEPVAKVLSPQLDIASISNDLLLEIWQETVPGKVGIRPDRPRLVDGFGRMTEGLGPVTAAYFCYRSQGRLVAVHTQTFKKLWERPDLPHNCLVFGDDDEIHVWRKDEALLQTLSAIDGRLLREQPWKIQPDDVLMHDGSMVWSVVRHPLTTVQAIDAHTMSTVWSRTFADKSIPFAMDQTAIGVLEANGVLNLLSSRTGAPLGEALTLEVPDRLERIICLHDRHRWYLAVSEPVPRLQILQMEQVWGGLQMGFVKGWLYGIDRQNAGVTWRRYLDSEPLQYAGHHVAPVLVQVWQRSVDEEKSDSPRERFLKVIDTRSGRLLMNRCDKGMQPYWALLPDENFEKLDIHTERETFRLNYTSRTQQQQRATDRN